MMRMLSAASARPCDFVCSAPNPTLGIDGSMCHPFMVGTITKFLRPIHQIVGVKRIAWWYPNGISFDLPILNIPTLLPIAGTSSHKQDEQQRHHRFHLIPSTMTTTESVKQARFRTAVS